MSSGGAVEAGWYPDPLDRTRYRYWDGADWTDHLHSGSEPIEVEPRGSRRVPLAIAAVCVVALVVGVAVWRSDGASSPAGATSLASGDLFTCALSSGGRVSCWGSDVGGSLGPRAIGSRSTGPVDVVSGARSIAAGGSRACAVLAAGRATCWGAGSGHLAAAPVSGIMQISTTTDHTCALVARSVRCWGKGQLGQLGSAAPSATTRPVAVAGISDATAVAVGPGFSCAVVAGGRVSCWGDNSSGQLGTPDLTSRPKPEDVPGISGAKDLALGEGYGCAASSSGSVTCWGRNDRGQLGRGTASSLLGPSPVLDVRAVDAVSVSRWTTCAIGAGHLLSCWGDDTFGQLGDGLRSDPRLQPVAAAALGAATAVSVGSFHACAVVRSGRVRCWGSDSDGQLGDGGAHTSTAPVTVSP